MLTINTNSTSLIAQNNLSKSQSALSTSLQRLSSGMRINSAADDAAGLAISTRMGSQINGINQAVRNANDGVSLTQTADGAMASISDSLQRMRDLAVQSSNATNSASDRAALQGEVNQLVQQINSVASNTSFNGVNLLDGSFSNQAFQVGANQGETLQVGSIASAKADSLGVGTTSSFSTTVTSAAVVKGAIGAAGVTVNGYGVGPSVNDGVSDGAGAESAIAKAASFNAVSGATGVTASVTATSVTGAAPTTLAAIAGNNTDYISVNGVKIGAIALGITVTDQGSNVAAAVNAVANQTGVTASVNTSTGAVTLTAQDGRNISLIGKGTGATATNTGLTLSTDAAAAGATTSSVVGAGTAAVGALAAGDLTINGLDVGAVVAGTTVTTQGDNVAAAINALSAKTGVTATNAAGKLTLAVAAGHDITVGGNSTNAAATVTATGLGAGAVFTASTATITYGGVKLNTTSSSGITLGGKDIGTINQTAKANAATSTFGTGVSSIDVSTAAGAASAISTIDSALQSVNASRANLGAIQNRFTAVVSNLQTTSTNLSAAKSRITDTDFAAETANMTRNQILQQAGTAMLAQANALPQSVLSLLK
jgi:flagellin